MKKAKLLVLIIALIALSCAPVEQRTRLSGAGVASDNTSCNEASFYSGIDTCGSCYIAGQCRLSLPGMCKVNIFHYDGNGELIDAFRSIDSTSYTLGQNVELNDRVYIESLEGEELKHCFIEY